MGTKTSKYNKLCGLNVKLARTKFGLTQEELAEKADLTRDTISAIERGIKSPTVATVGAIADALGIDMYKLFIFD